MNDNMLADRVANTRIFSMREGRAAIRRRLSVIEVSSMGWDDFVDTLLLPKNFRLVLEKLEVSAGDCVRTDGRYSLSYDGGRLDVYPLAGGRLVLESLLVDLPTETTARRAMLELALRYSTSLMKKRQDTLAQTPAADALVLQRELDSVASPLEMETSVSQFLNAVGRWQQVLLPTQKTESMSWPR